MIAALMIVMGACIFPVSAFAATADSTPPTVQASVSGNNLTVTADDTGSGVQYVYIDGNRYDYGASPLTVDAKTFANDAAEFSIYAVDAFGNQSSVLLVANPFYVPSASTSSGSASSTSSATSFPLTSPATTPATSTSSSTASSSPSTAFTPSGQATVLDQATSADGKDFYTFQTPDGNVFYLVIDHQKSGDNVYFLNAVTEQDLAALAAKANNGTANTGTTSSSFSLTNGGTAQTTSNSGEAAAASSTATSSAKSSGGNTGMIVFLVVAVAGIGGAAYYFKIVRPKKQGASGNDSDEEADSEDDEEMQFENEPDEPDDEPEDDEPAPSGESGDSGEDDESEPDDDSV